MANTARFIGGFSGPFAAQLAEQNYLDELAMGSELPNRGGVRVGYGSPITPTAQPVMVGTPYPPNPATLPAVRNTAGTPDTSRFARGFTLGEEGATVSPARPTPAAPKQIGYNLPDGSNMETVPSRGVRPVTPTTTLSNIDPRTGMAINPATARGVVSNTGMNLLRRAAASPFMKGLGIAGAAAQGATAINDFQKGDYDKALLNTAGAVGGFTGPVGKALSAGIGVGGLIDAGLKAAKIGGYADEVYTPWTGAVAPKPVAAAVEPDRTPMDMTAALAQASRGATSRTIDHINPAYDATADDASRLTARNAQYSATAKDAAETDARGEYAAGILKQEAAAREKADTKNRIAVLNDIISNSGRPDSVAAAKNEMASLLGQQQVGIKQAEIQARLDAENIKGGFGIKGQTLRNAGGADVANIHGAAQIKAAEIAATERTKSAEIAAEKYALYNPDKTEAAKIKADTDRANKITAAESSAYNEYIKLNPQDIEGAVAAAQGAGAVARGLVITKPGTPAVKGKKHWYGDTPDIPAVPAQYGQPRVAGSRYAEGDKVYNAQGQSLTFKGGKWVSA